LIVVIVVSAFVWQYYKFITFKKAFSLLPSSGQLSFSKNCKDWYVFNDNLKFKDFYKNYDEYGPMFYKIGSHDIPALYNNRGHALIGSTGIVLTPQGVLAYSDQVLTFYRGRFNKDNIFGFLGKLSKGQLKSSLELGFFKGRPGLFIDTATSGGVSCVVKYPDDTNCVALDGEKQIKITSGDLNSILQWHTLLCKKDLAYNYKQLELLSNYAKDKCSGDAGPISLTVAGTNIQNLCKLVEDKIISKIH